jgi:hypothetical protein
MGKPSKSDVVLDQETAQDSITSLANPSTQITEDTDEKLNEGQNDKGLEQWNKPTVNIYRYLVCPVVG